MAKKQILQDFDFDAVETSPPPETEDTALDFELEPIELELDAIPEPTAPVYVIEPEVAPEVAPIELVVCKLSPYAADSLKSKEFQLTVKGKTYCFRPPAYEAALPVDAAKWYCENQYPIEYK